MSRTRVGRSLGQFGLLLVTVFILLFTQQGQATTTNNLNFFKNYFLTGDYVVSGVGLRGTGTGGIATGTIHFSGDKAVPADADIMAAFLYWETVVTPNSGPGTAGAKFRDYDISGLAVELNPNGTAPCWSSGGGAGGAEGAHAMKSYRADVLQFLAQKHDGNGQPIGKRLVNDADLTANNLAPLNTVQLPDAGTGNAVPSTAGASLFILYRDPSKPLTGVVIYDGGYTMDQSHQSLILNVQGFFQAANGNAAAKMTHIVGDGQANFSEQVVFNGGVLATNPFQGFEGPVSDPAWDSWTSPLFSVPTSVNPAATVEVNHGDFTPFDCLSWGAIIFSTPVLDTDSDGLLDAWETISGLTDPDGQVLPDIHAMGANPNVQDLFVEIGYMTTGGYNTPLGQVTAHNHMPSDAVLNNIITTFHNAGARPNFPCPNGVVGSCPINLHLDVGTNYSGAIPNANQCANNWQPACGIIRPTLARGGEAITETACTASPTNNLCQFPDYPGTIGWKAAFEFLRDQPLNYPDEASCVAAGSLCRRRFDASRRHIFKYGMYAHATGVPESLTDDPGTPNDERHTPKSISGVSDGGTGGGDFVVSLGRWGNNFRGSDFVQWSTTVHEIGHTTGLRHGGPRATPANPAPNCRPDYESVMSYLFQVRGIITPSGPTVDLSRQQLNNLNESSLTETALTAEGNAPMMFPTRWYAPLSSSILDTLIGTSPATRHCNGSVLLPTDPLTVRVDGTSTGPIDWNANGLFAPQDVSQLAQDINFNGYTGDPLKDGTFAGYNDWFNIDLRQTASRPHRNNLSLEIDYTDLSGDSQDTYGDSQDTYGDSQDTYGDSQDTYGDSQETYGDSQDTFGKDLDFDTATSVGNAPNRLRYTTTNQAIILNWDPPHAGNVIQYQVWRATGPITATNLPVKIYSTTQVVPPTTYSDTSSKNNVTYSYFVTATVSAKQSGPSNIISAMR